MVLHTLHAFISHNGFSKLTFQEGKPFAQEHTVSDSEDVYLPARKSVRGAVLTEEAARNST